MNRTPTNRNRSALLLLATGLFACALAAPACSSDDEDDGGNDPAGCNENPWTCPAQQTCWIDSSFEPQCLNSGQGQAGDTCTATVGSPECGDGLICFQEPNSADGVCVPFCDATDPAHGCTAPATCVHVQIQGNGTATDFHACFDTSGGGGAGGTGGAGEGGAGGGAGAAGGSGGSGGTGGAAPPAGGAGGA